MIPPALRPGLVAQTAILLALAALQLLASRQARITVTFDRE